MAELILRGLYNLTMASSSFSSSGLPQGYVLGPPLLIIDNINTRIIKSGNEMMVF